MKKLIFTTVFTLLSSFIFAQSQWSITYHEGDALKGTESCYVNTFVADNGDAFMSQSNHDVIRIYTNDGIFDTYKNYVQLIVGFYIGEELKEKKEVWIYVPSDQANFAFSDRYKQKKIGRKIKEHLKTMGSVRIVANKYGGADFDITIPMNKELK